MKRYINSSKSHDKDLEQLASIICSMLPGSDRMIWHENGSVVIQTSVDMVKIIRTLMDYGFNLVDNSKGSSYLEKSGFTASVMSDGIKGNKVVLSGDLAI